MAVTELMGWHFDEVWHRVAEPGVTVCGEVIDLQQELVPLASVHDRRAEVGANLCASCKEGRPDNFYELMSSQEARHADQLDYSLRMITDIIRGYDSAVDANQLICARAMLDAFYVHIRLLSDFLVKRTKHLDFGPADFGVSWDIPTSNEADNLHAYWTVASQFVVHFGQARVPERLEDLDIFQVGTPAFRAMATDALKVYAVFQRKLDDATSAWADCSRIPDFDLEPEAWKARNLGDRTQKLRASLREACSVCGLDADALLNGDSDH